MFRALWIKHWMQLRTLRWVGFGLGIVLPFFLWAGAAAGKRGWLGVRLGGYDLSTLFGEALPAFAAMLWGLLAVMFAAQTFVGDRADGTERFLLERPVPRRKTWLARVLSSLASSLLVVAGHALYITALVALVRDATVVQPYSTVLLATAGGAALVLLGTIGGMAAGEMVRTPMQAVLIGGVLAALPVGVAMFLASVFQLVAIDHLHLGFLVAPILPLAMVLSSYRAGCLGEPAGRGRIRRGVGILAVALVVTPALFAAAAPFVLRGNVVGGWPEGVASGADRLVVLGGSYGREGGWLIDADQKETLRFLPPPVRSAAWNADGSRVAVLHQWGVLGSIGPPTVEILDASGETLGSFRIESEERSYARGLHWAGDLVLLREWLGVRKGRLSVLDPRRGVVGAVPIEGEGGGQSWSVMGPVEDGSIYLHRLSDQNPRTYELARIDLAGFRLEEPLLVETDDLPLYARKFLSPSGRFWARAAYDERTRRFDSHFVDLSSGARTDLPGTAILGWLSGDRLLRAEPQAAGGTRLVVSAAGGEELLSRSFERGVSVRLSPDRRRFLVKRWSAEQPRGSFGFGYYGPGLHLASAAGVLIGDGSGWTEVETPLPERGDGLWITWGGPGTLVLSGKGSYTAVADADADAGWTRVLGRRD